MKKLRTKSKTIGRIIFGGTLLLMVFGLIVVNQPLGLKAAPKDVKGEVRAEPEPVTDEVTIDEGSSIEYLVPKDASGKFEAAMPEGFFQGEKYGYLLTKKEEDSLHLGYANSVDTPLKAVELLDGNFIIGIRNRAVTGITIPITPPNQSEKRIIEYLYFLVDAKGNILKRINSATNQTPTDISSSLVNKTYNSGGEKFVLNASGNVETSITGFSPDNQIETYMGRRQIVTPKLGISYGPKPTNANTVGSLTLNVQNPITKDYYAIGNSNSSENYNGNMKVNAKKSNQDFSTLKLVANKWPLPTFESLGLPKLKAGEEYRATPNSFGVINEQTDVTTVMTYWSKQMRDQNAFLNQNKNAGYNFYSQYKNVNGAFDSNTIPVTAPLTNNMILGYGEPVMQTELSNKDELVVLIIREDKSELISMNLLNMTQTTLKVFPKNTRITISKTINTQGQLEGYSFFGSIDEYSGIFSEYIDINQPGIAIGDLDLDFNPVTVSSIAAKNTVVTHFMSTKNDPDTFFIAGETGDNKLAKVSNLGKPKAATTEKVTDAFFGTLLKKENYGPGIKFSSDGLVDIKGSSAKVEVELLKGVSVTDTIDLSATNLSGQKTQKWLDNRINRNPRKIVYSSEIGKEDELNIAETAQIDWEKLGFTKEYAGPQTLKYFVTDSTNLVSARSRWINKKTPQTIIKDDFAIDAQNFTMPLTDVGTLVNDLVKRKAKSMAWNLETHVIDEDTSKDPAVLSNKVTINQGQLAAIQGATVAKPYPLELTYQTANGPIVNKIWVFVTDDQTTVDEDQELVMYGLDHSVAQHLAKDQTNALAIDKDHGSVRVYDLNDAVNKGVAVTDLPPIAGVQADGTVLAGDKIIADVPQLTAIKNATVQQGKDNTEFPLKVTFDNGISVDLTVTVVAKQAELTIKFQDADSKTVYFEADGVTPKADLVYTEIVGDKFLASSIKDRPEVSAVITKVLTEGYPSLNGYDPTEEIEISKDDTTYIFKFNGAVELTKVTPKMTFETGVVWIRDQTLFYESAEDFLLTVRDTRQSTGATEGEKLRGKFSVNAKLATNFIHDTVANAILKDAQIVYFNGTKDVILSLDGGAQEVIKNTASSTDKNFEIMLDDKGQAKNNLRLEIPDSGILEGTYNASIEWDLIQGP